MNLNALMLKESSLAIEKVFDSERLTKSCCNWLWYCCLNLTVKTYLTISWNILFKFRLAVRKPTSADKLEEFAERKPRPACKLMVISERKPRPAGKLMVPAECKPRPAGKGKFAVRKPGPAGNDKFAVCKPRPAGKGKFAVRKPWTPRPAGKLYWELSVAAIGCSAKDSSSDFLP